MFNLLKVLQNKRGAHIVILALIFPACVVTMAALIDIGLFYTSRAHFQNAVDAAAVAGAKKLPATASNNAIVVSAAKSFILSNPGNSQGNDNQPTRNYIADAQVIAEFSNNEKTFGPTGNKYCRVTLTAPANSIMLKNILHQAPLITVQAVAVRESTGYAIFAGDGICKNNQNALWLSINSITIEGNVHTNGDLSMASVASTIKNGRITAFGYSGNANNVTTVYAKEKMPDPTKQTGEIKKTHSLTLNQGVGSAAMPIIYTADTGDMNVQINTVDPCYASFYAPNGNISFQGNNLKLYGTIIAKSIDFQLNTLEIHAPSAMLNAQVKLIK